MKKIILFIILVSVGFLFAELEVDIPFDSDIIGNDFSVVGEYDYESDWITITNIGSTDETYSVLWSFTDLPAGWTASVCNEIGLCYIPFMAADVLIPAGQSLLVHIVIGVHSTGGFALDITLDGGDLIEPVYLPFTFNTADNVSAEQELVLASKLTQNYPNPFNPSTTIAFELTTQELSTAKIAIYNVKGQIVKTFNNLSSNSVDWNGIDNVGKKVDSGIYFYQLTAGVKFETRKMLLLK